MGRNFDSEGRFQSDKHPDLPPDRLRVNIANPNSHRALRVLASCYKDVDSEFAADLDARLDALYGPNHPPTCDEDGCVKGVSIREAGTDQDGVEVKGQWCLDHAPERYAESAARIRAFEAWADKWAVWVSKREAEDKTVPSWRAAASSAFSAGVEHGRATSS